MDFLIWQGHDSEAVQRMTLRQIELWSEVAGDRLKALHAAPEKGRGR